MSEHWHQIQPRSMYHYLREIESFFVLRYKPVSFRDGHQNCERHSNRYLDICIRHWADYATGEQILP